jgi:prepilin-type N-terminal cleavage/methylation domain-containing protein
LRTHRRGYALIEVLVVLTVAAVMLTLCAGMVHLLLKLDRSGRAASEEAADLTRLAHDFRADIHAAEPATPPARAADRWTLSLDGGKTVEYQVRPRDVLRTLREGDKVRRHETYRRPPRASVSIEVGHDGPRSLASLVVDRPPDGQADSLYRDYRIEAELSRDRRINPRPQ